MTRPEMHTSTDQRGRLRPIERTFCRPMDGARGALWFEVA